MIETLIPENEQQWLQWRTQDITSTDVSALFGLSPYKTEFELFHEKREGLVVHKQASERMKWGNRFESAIAYGVAEDQGWVVSPFKCYIRDTVARIGSSFDFQIDHPVHGIGIMEIKNVDGLQYRRNWIEDESGDIQAPEHIELQVQHQMEVADIDWCALVPMVGGNEAKLVFRKRDRQIGQALRAKVAAFWARVEANDPPSADYSRDADLIAKLYGQVEAGRVFNADDDVETSSLVLEYKQAQLDAAAAEARAKVAKAKILERVTTAEKIVGSFGSISVSRTKDTPPTIITAEMIGKTYGGRTGYRQFKANWKE